MAFSKVINRDAAGAVVSVTPAVPFADTGGIDPTSFRGSKTIHLESLEPGLQHFPSEQAFLTAAQQNIDHRQSPSGVDRIAPLFIGALAALPVVGPALAVGTKLLFGLDQAKERAAQAVATDALVTRVVSQLSPTGGNTVFEDFDFSSILNTGADLVGKALQARLTPQVHSSPVQPFMMASAMAPAAGGVLASLQSVSGILGRLGVGGVAAGAVAAFGIIRSAAGRILRVVLPSGVKVSAEAAKKLINAVGFTAAAAALGIGVQDLAEWMLQGDRKRRGKGISAANIRTTRRTMKTVMGIHRQIVDACSSARVPLRRRAAPPMIGKRCK